MAAALVLLLFGVAILYYILYVYYNSKGMLKSNLNYGVDVLEVTTVLIHDITSKWRKWKEKRKR